MVEKPVIDMRPEDFRTDARDRADITLCEFLCEIHHLTAQMNMVAGFATLEHGGVAA